MIEPSFPTRRTVLIALAGGLPAAAAMIRTVGVVAAEPAPSAPAASPKPPASASTAVSKSAEPPANVRYETATLRGRIVWQIDALKRKFEVAVDPDAAKSVVCLETPAGETAGGELVPIVKDFRGRGFHLDPKLHEFDWELVVRRYPGSPFVQVVRTYVWKEGKRLEFDYWCDICAIPMYELKECECCQGPIRFRYREAGE